MKFEGFNSTADLIGHRIWLKWDYVLDTLETFGDVPDVIIRRKHNDFAFPPLVPGDPYLVFDSAGFPPAPIPGILAVTDLPDEQVFEDELRVERSTISIATITDNVPLETQRQVRSIFFNASGVLVRVRIEVLDADSLEAYKPTYYEFDDGSAPSPQTIDTFRSVTVPGDVHGLNRWLWQSLPEIYRSQDTQLIADSAYLPGVPEAGRSGGQLRRFTDMFGMGFEMLRNSAEALRGLRNLDSTESKYLELLGRNIGWDPSTLAPLPQQRNEIRTATRLFDVLGTVQSLRALVTHQTGWRSQVAELAQNITRANLPAARSIYIRSERSIVPPGEWRGAEDSSDLFAFPIAGAVGGAGLPAVLTSTSIEPFQLRTGMELTISVDGNVPVRIRFGADDFAQINLASAAEIAVVINRAFDDLVASEQAGAVQLESVLTGLQASLQISASRQSLLVLSEATTGPVTPLMQTSGQLRIFYKQRFNIGRSDDENFYQAAQNKHVKGTSVGKPNQQSLYYKSWGHGSWRDEIALPDWTDNAGELFATVLPGDNVWLLWTENTEKLKFSIGNGRVAEPATLTSLLAEPFSLIVGTQVSFLLPGGLEIFSVNAFEYVDPANATAIEVAAAMTAQMGSISSQALADGSVRLQTVVTGDDVTLQVDLGASNAARSLGLGARDLHGVGHWDPQMDWQGAMSGPDVWNPVADPTAVPDPDGGIRAAWSEHQDGIWQIRLAHWSTRITIATSAGVAQQTAGGAWSVWTTVEGLPSNIIRAVAVNANGTLWFATDSGLARRQTDGTFATFTTVDGLVSNDIRDIAILPSGSVVCVTPLGVSEIDLAGVISSTLASPTGLISSDIYAVSVTGTGELWLATANGIGRRDNLGRWSRWGTGDGLPAVPLTSISCSGKGEIAAASSSGVSVLHNNVWLLQTVDDGLPSNDIRDLTYSYDGSLLGATAAGLARFKTGRWSVTTTADGLPVNSLFSVTETSDKRLLLGTNSGLAISTPVGDSWTLLGLADGLPSISIAKTHANWSAPQIIAGEPGANREPHLAVEAGGESWLIWSQRENITAGLVDNWSLQLTRFDPTTRIWAAPQTLTVPLPTGSADRSPWAQTNAGGGFRIFFSNNRQGGQNLGWISVDALGVPGAPELMTVETQENHHPAAITGPNGESWLFHRADSPVVQAQVTSISEPGNPDRASLRLPETGALSQQAGARSPVMSHVARHALRRRFGDPLTYSPEHPDKTDAELPGSSHLYTRRTLVLYMRQAPFGKSVSQEEIARLLQLLNKLKPINLRLLLVIAPDPLTEVLYPPGADIGESWSDSVPVVDVLTGLSDATSVVIPGLAVLLANDLDSLSADSDDGATLLRRTWFPDLL